MGQAPYYTLGRETKRDEYSPLLERNKHKFLKGTLNA